MWKCFGLWHDFDQWKTFSENHKPIRVWLWLVYKFTENNCHSRLFSKSIQTQKEYFASLNKISLLENYFSYQAKIFLGNKTPRELTSSKISHIKWHRGCKSLTFL